MASQFITTGPSQTAHGAPVNVLRLPSEKNWADQPAIPPTHELGLIRCGNALCLPIHKSIHLSLHLAIRRCKQAAIGPEGQQRPTVSIHVVLEIENFWKSSAGGFVFGPRTV